MIFKPTLAKAVLEGRKVVTRRLVREDNPRSPWHPDQAPRMVGKRRAIVPGRGVTRLGTVRILSVECETFEPSQISPVEAIAEGTSGPAEFRRIWMQLHGASLAPVEVWRVEMADPVAIGDET